MDSQKNWIKDVFDRAAPTYGTRGSSFFEYFGKRLAAESGTKPGDHILDVATGRGAVLFPLARIAGPTGRIVGIDISSKMLEAARADTQVRGFKEIDLQLMDAEKLEFPDDTFDIVSCGFALFFFPSLSKTLAEFRRVLKPGGKLAVSIWGKKPDLTNWVKKQCKKISNSSDSLLATPLSTEESLHFALKKAHFQDIRTLDETKMFLHATAEDWWDSLWMHGTRASLEKLSNKKLGELRKLALEKAKNSANNTVISEELHVFYGVGSKRNG